MIKINYSYTILFASTVAGVGTAADSTPAAVLWRNGSASGVSVTVSTTAQTGLYKAVFTTDSGWANGDFLELYATATIAGTAGYLAKVWSSTEIGAAVLDSSTQSQLASIETAVDAGNNYHVTTLARLGAWAGSGINTILGALRAIAAKATGLTPTDLSTGTTYNNAAHSLEAGAATIASRAASTLTRNPLDTGVITFAWPVSGAEITGEVSINNATYSPVVGVIAFLREDAGKYYYTLNHHAADRPATAGSARYSFTDGEYTRYVVLRVVESGDTGEAMLKLDWETITGEVPSRSVLNALRHIRNKWALDGNTKTVYAEDDTTPAYTTTITADGAGNITADTPN